MTDSWRHKGMRRNLIKTLQEKGISDAATLEIMGKLPRHFFLDKAFEEHAYEDKAFPIGSEQTISQPFTVAYMTQLLDVKTGEKILEIGTGSGYQAAVLAMLGASVFTIERQESLFQKTKQLLVSLKLPNIRCFFKDGSKGLLENAPFDKIIVTAGAPVVPDDLKNQLKIGGRLVIPVGGDVEQRMLVIDRKSAVIFEEKWLETFRFVPFLGGIVEK
jgi:protein-L-isoaspartate(D-aspartate) O-methyltransferase